MPPEETREFEQAVSHARERLDDLSPLMLMANRLDQAADMPTVYGDGEEDGSAA